MVTVQVKEEGPVRSLRMEGHARYNPGNDIVCAACSAIAYALMGWIANSPEHIKNVDDLYEKDGLIGVRVEGDESFAAAFDMAVIGLMQIEKKYPKNVRVQEV